MCLGSARAGVLAMANSRARTRDLSRAADARLRKLFGATPNRTRGTRVLPRSTRTAFVSSIHDLMRLLKILLQRAPRHHRRRRRFGVTLVVWNEDAREECFQGGAAVA